MRPANTFSTPIVLKKEKEHKDSMMEIEIVEFYEFKRDEKKQRLEGTLHVYLINEKIDLRGIYLVRHKNKVYIQMIYKKAIDLDTKEEVSYPIFSYADPKKNKELLEAIREKGGEYVLKNTAFKKMMPTTFKKNPDKKVNKPRSKPESFDKPKYPTVFKTNVFAKK